MTSRFLPLIVIMAPVLYIQGVTAAECPAPVTGTYTNQEYGFAFDIPKGLKGSLESPCSVENDGKCICIGNHGLAFDLGNGAVLGVFADYAAELDEPTLGDVLREALNRMGSTKIDDGKHITSVHSYRLQGRAGYRIEATAPDPNNDQSRIDHIEFVFLDGARSDIYLSAPIANVPRARMFLMELVKTWRWIPRH